MSEEVASAPVDDIVVTSTDNGVDVPQAPDPAPPEPTEPEPDEPEGDELEAKAASDAGKKLQAKKGSLQARIDAITKEKYDTQRERDDARYRAESLERELQALKAPKDAKADTKAEPRYTRPKPTEDEIGTKYQAYGDYVEDLTEWKVEQRDAQRAESEQRSRVQQSHVQHAQRFSEKIQAAEQTDPEFWSKISPDVVNLRPSGSLEPGERPTALTAIADIVFTSDSTTELMAYLSANTKEFQRLSTLPPNHLYREMGRLEASLTRPAAASPTGPAAATRPTSQAAPPIKPVGSAASASDPLEITDDLPMDEHIRRMNALDEKKRRRR